METNLFRTTMTAESLPRVAVVRMMLHDTIHDVCYRRPPPVDVTVRREWLAGEGGVATLRREKMVAVYIYIYIYSPVASRSAPIATWWGDDVLALCAAGRRSCVVNKSVRHHDCDVIGGYHEWWRNQFWFDLCF